MNINNLISILQFSRLGKSGERPFLWFNLAFHLHHVYIILYCQLPLGDLQLLLASKLMTKRARERGPDSWSCQVDQKESRSFSLDPEHLVMAVAVSWLLRFMMYLGRII